MAKKKGGFKYRKRSADSQKKRASQRAGNFDSIFKDHVTVFTPKEGSYNIRILPISFDGNPDDHFGVDLWVNYGIGPDDCSYLSLSKMKQEPDPIEEERRRAQSMGDDDYVKELNPTKRVAFYLIDRDNEKEGVQLWAAPWTFDRDLAVISKDNQTGELIEIDNPDEGFDVSFDRQGTGLKTKYVGLSVARRDTPLHDDIDQQEEWLEYIEDNPIPDALQYFDYDYIKSKIDGTRSPDDDIDEDDEDERPYDDDDDQEEEKKSRRRSRRSQRDEDEDDEDEKLSRMNRRGRDNDEDDDDDDDEDDDEPRSRRRRSRSRIRDDGDDDDNDDDEDSGRSRSRARKRDDDDDEDEDDDEEESRSSRRRSRRRRNS